MSDMAAIEESRKKARRVIGFLTDVPSMFSLDNINGVASIIRGPEPYFKGCTFTNKSDGTAIPIEQPSEAAWAAADEWDDAIVEPDWKGQLARIIQKHMSNRLCQQIAAHANAREVYEQAVEALRPGAPRDGIDEGHGFRLAALEKQANAQKHELQDASVVQALQGSDIQKLREHAEADEQKIEQQRKRLNGIQSNLDAGMARRVDMVQRMDKIEKRASDNELRLMGVQERQIKTHERFDKVDILLGEATARTRDNARKLGDFGRILAELQDRMEAMKKLQIDELNKINAMCEAVTNYKSTHEEPAAEFKGCIMAGREHKWGPPYFSEDGTRFLKRCRACGDTMEDHP